MRCIETDINANRQDIATKINSNMRCIETK